MIKLLIGALLIVGLWLLIRRGRTRPSLGLAEARETLGVAADADAATIREAHRRLIARVHPDSGGNAALAARINAARDVLLRQLVKESA